MCAAGVLVCDHRVCRQLDRRQREAEFLKHVTAVKCFVMCCVLLPLYFTLCSAPDAQPAEGSGFRGAYTYAWAATIVGGYSTTPSAPSLFSSSGSFLSTVLSAITSNDIQTTSLAAATDHD